MMDGSGTCTWPKGTKFIGEYKNGMRNGQGILTLPNGTKYTGNLKTV
jgi:hypothetical protein